MWHVNVCDASAYIANVASISVRVPSRKQCYRVIISLMRLGWKHDTVIHCLSPGSYVTSYVIVTYVVWLPLGSLRALLSSYWPGMQAIDDYTAELQSTHNLKFSQRLIAKPVYDKGRDADGKFVEFKLIRASTRTRFNEGSFIFSFQKMTEIAYSAVHNVSHAATMNGVRSLLISLGPWGFIWEASTTYLDQSVIIFLGSGSVESMALYGIWFSIWKLCDMSSNTSLDAWQTLCGSLKYGVDARRIFSVGTLRQGVVRTLARDFFSNQACVVWAVWPYGYGLWAIGYISHNLERISVFCIIVRGAHILQNCSPNK